MNYVPLKEAAKKHNVDEQVLTQLISAGMINAKKEAGEILVAVDKNGNGGPQTKEEIISAEFAHLQGHLITISQAAKKYELNRDTILGSTTLNRDAGEKPGAKAAGLRERSTLKGALASFALSARCFSVGQQASRFSADLPRRIPLEVGTPSE